MKNSLEIFWCWHLKKVNVVASFQNVRMLEIGSLNANHVDIFPLASLTKLQSLRLQYNSLTCQPKDGSNIRTVEDVLSCFTDLRFLKVEKHSLQHIRFLKSMLELQFLDIIFPQIPTILNEKGVDELSEEMNSFEDHPQLHYLNLKDWELPTDVHSAAVGTCDVMFETFGRHLASLQKLFIVSPTFSTQGLSRIEPISSRLVKLWIEDARFFDAEENNNDEPVNFYSLISKLQNLEDFAFRSYRFSPQRDQLGKKQKTTTLSNLKKLDLTNCKNISENLFRDFISRHAATLEVLIMDGCDLSFGNNNNRNISWLEYLVDFSNLKCLHCQWPQQEDKAIEEDILETKISFPELEELHWTNSSGNENSGADDNSLFLISSKFQKLRNLKITGFNGITERGALAALPRLKNLENLELKISGVSKAEKNMLEQDTFHSSVKVKIVE